jgi:hypothetical protein
MAQGNFTLDQTTLLHSDFVNMAVYDDPKYGLTFGGSSILELFKPHQIALAAYAVGYSGNYYRKNSAFANFSAAIKAGTYVTIYEELKPSDCQDKGIQALEILKGNGDLCDETKIIPNDNENAWDLTTANTATVYWRQEGTKIRVAMPNSFTGSVTMAWSADYKRLPTFPQVASDSIDVPAEDVDIYYSKWKAEIRTP